MAQHPHHTDPPRVPRTLGLRLAITAAVACAATTLASTVSPPVDPGVGWIEKAVQAAESGRLDHADSALRRALRRPETRSLAIELLTDLHRDPRFSLEGDEESIDQAYTQANTPLVRYESGAFVLLTDADQTTAQATLAMLERTRREMLGFANRLGVPGIPHRHKLLAVLFHEHEQFSRFAVQDGMMADWAGGYFGSENNRVVLFNEQSSPGFRAASEELAQHEARLDEQRREAERARRQGKDDLAIILMNRAAELDRQLDDARRSMSDYLREARASKTVHEAAHLVAFNVGLQDPTRPWPFWFSEGLATSFETDNPSQAFGPRHPSPTRERELAAAIADGRTMSYERLVGLTAAPDHDADAAGAMYAQSYALFTYLAHHRAAALRDFIGDIAEHDGLARLSTSRRAEFFRERFRERFGSPTRLQRLIER